MAEKNVSHSIENQVEHANNDGRKNNHSQNYSGVVDDLAFAWPYNFFELTAKVAHGTFKTGKKPRFLFFLVVFFCH